VSKSKETVGARHANTSPDLDSTAIRFAICETSLVQKIPGLIKVGPLGEASFRVFRIRLIEFKVFKSVDLGDCHGWNPNFKCLRLKLIIILVCFVFVHHLRDHLGVNEFVMFLASFIVW
jgi:hypothetical protein